MVIYEVNILILFSYYVNTENLCDDGFVIISIAVLLIKKNVNEMLKKKYWKVLMNDH